MTAYRSGQTLMVTDTDQQVVIWSAAPGAGRYWAHLLTATTPEMVLLQIRMRQDRPLPLVQIIEYV